MHFQIAFMRLWPFKLNYFIIENWLFIYKIFLTNTSSYKAASPGLFSPPTSLLLPLSHPPPLPTHS